MYKHTYCTRYYPEPYESTVTPRPRSGNPSRFTDLFAYSLHRNKTNMVLTKQLVSIVVEELGHLLQEEEGILRGAHIRISNISSDILVAGDPRIDLDLLLEVREPSAWSNLKIIPDFRSKSAQVRLKKTISRRAYANRMFHKKKQNKITNKRQGCRMKVFRSKTKKKTKTREKYSKKIFCNGTRNWETLELRVQIFTRLKQLVKGMTLPNAWVTMTSPGLTAIQLVLHTDDTRKLQLHLIPQIVVRSWSECPGLVPQTSLPLCLQEYVTTRVTCGSPILCIRPTPKKSHRSLLYDVWSLVGCSTLERRFLKEEYDVREIVRFATSVKDHLNWTSKFGLRSFHLTRLAIKNATALRNRTTWEGFKVLLRYLDEELQEGGVWDCFVLGQVIYHQVSPSKLARLRCDLREVQRWKFEGVMATVRREDVAGKSRS